MTEPEFQTAQDLVLVRQIRYMLDLIESSTNVGAQDSSAALIDVEVMHARKLARLWEQKLQEMLSVRKPRSKNGNGEAKEAAE